MRLIVLCLMVIFVSGCTTSYPNQNVTGQQFPDISGQTLEEELVRIPADFNDEFTLLLIGYKHKSQFDIDRWLIAFDFTNTSVPVYELPTLQGMFPRMFSTVIDNSMREGIPKSLWKGVITIYEDGDKVQKFTGNEIGKNARVVLINRTGKILYFYDEGFDVAALNKIRKLIGATNENLNPEYSAPN